MVHICFFFYFSRRLIFSVFDLKISEYYMTFWWRHESSERELTLAGGGGGGGWDTGIEKSGSVSFKSSGWDYITIWRLAHPHTDESSEKYR
jgi:hypothetical protein